MRIETQKALGGVLFAMILASGLGLVSDAVIPTGPAHHAGAGGEGAQMASLPGGAQGGGAAAPGEGGGQTAAAGGADFGQLLAAANPADGQASAKKCTSCHTVEEGGANRVGPNLHGIVGADIAAKPGYTYSSALQGKEGAWSYENLSAFIANPKGFAPGTKMTFAGIADDKERANLIAYLRSLSPAAPPLPGAGG